MFNNVFNDTYINTFACAAAQHWQHWAAMVDCILMDMFGVGAFKPENIKCGQKTESTPEMKAMRGVFAALKVEHCDLASLAANEAARFVTSGLFEQFVDGVILNLAPNRSVAGKIVFWLFC